MKWFDIIPVFFGIVFTLLIIIIGIFYINGHINHFKQNVIVGSILLVLSLLFTFYTGILFGSLILYLLRCFPCLKNREIYDLSILERPNLNVSIV